MDQARGEQSTVVARAGELARFAPDSFQTVTLLANEHLRVLLAALEPGQEIPLHAPGVDLVVTVADGVGELLAGGRVYPLHAGDVAVVPAGETRGVRARTARLVLVNVVTPPPSAADHARVPAGAAWPPADAGADPAGLIRREHAELRVHLDHLRSLAEAVDETEESDLRERLTRVVHFLREGVLAHAGHEEETVYPAAERLLRALGGATATMVLEHGSIAVRVDELERLAAGRYDASTRAGLRRSLVALEAVLRGHFDKEERVYLPLLAHLAAGEAESLAAALEAAGHGEQGHEHQARTPTSRSARPRGEGVRRGRP